MTQEAVVLENGRESDWVDPVISVEEDQFEWRVFNGHYTYHIAKAPYKELLIRNM